MAHFRTLDDLDVRGRRVLVRVDLNVPTRDGRVTDATRIERVAPTIAELADKGARVIVLSHFGRPKGRSSSAMSLSPLVAPLSQALRGRPVAFATDCIGPAAMSAATSLRDGDVLLLENVRFHGGEEANDPVFTKALAALGELYVNDAFSAAHRAHASTEGLARELPAAAGRLMQEELEALDAALTAPARPVMAVVGGAKVSSKLDVLGNLVGKVDVLAIGGGMANTFLFAQGIAVGKSLCERDLAPTARTIGERAAAAGCRIVLPVDAVCARRFEAGAPRETVAIGAVAGDAMILDVGPATVAAVTVELEVCRTLLWNGPLGAFELDGFAAGTIALAQAAARLTGRGKLVSVAGGGDTVAALAMAGVEDDFTYVSTAGGAFLEWLEGKELPGVAALAH
ncbi:MAG: phosphoglycerate kinase [Alphaproteobacteria bacterium]|nr:phosphoglycerate kinase [Alphaproteobacteria bacterium]